MQKIAEKENAKRLQVGRLASSKSATATPINKNAFHYYTPDFRNGRHRGEGKSNCEINLMVRKATNRFVLNVVDVRNKCGSFDQRSLVL